MQCAIWILPFILYILECGLVAMIEHYFFVYKLFKVLLAQREFFEIEIICAYCVCSWLIVGEMKLLQIRMLKSSLHCDSLLWIICQHFLKKINSVRIRSFENLREVFWLSFVQLKHEFSILFVFYLVDKF